MTGRITYFDCLRAGAMLYIVAVHHVLGALRVCSKEIINAKFA